MKKTNGKSILIFLLVIVWTGLMLWLFIYNKKSQKPDIPKDKPQEMKLENNSSDSEIIQGDFFETPGVNNDLQEDFLFIFDDGYSIPVSGTLPDPVIDQKEIDNDLQESPFKNNQNNSENPNVKSFPEYSSGEFLEMYDLFESLQGNLQESTKYIYQLPEVDNYIRSFAEKRGYQKRGFAQESEIINFEGIQTRAVVRDAYVAMRNEMKESDISLHFVSGYRSSTSQRKIFLEKMIGIKPENIPTGNHDKLLDQVLSRSSIPGYSKHHSGYAADFGCGNDYLVFSFAETQCYEWMSADNFYNAKRFGFIPSYPEGVERQGPDPEPWEYVWVGTDTIKNFSL